MISKVHLRRQQCADAAAPMPLYIIDVRSFVCFGGVSRELNACIYRETFKRQKHPIKTVYDNEESRQDIILISMHIRRGDIVSQNFQNCSRWINNEAYIEMANNLTVILREFFHNKKKIHVQIFAEGSNSIESIQNVGESITTTNMKEEIAADNVTLGATGLLESFSSMCYSDILVTTNSGFSALIFRVCERPISFYTGWDFSTPADTPDGIRMQIHYNEQLGMATSFGFNSSNFIEMVKQKLLYVNNCCTT